MGAGEQLILSEAAGGPLAGLDQHRRDPAPAMRRRGQQSDHRGREPGGDVEAEADQAERSVILQRDQPIRVWGHANQGETVTVTLDDKSESAVANNLQQWSVSFPAMKASSTLGSK